MLSPLAELASLIIAPAVAALGAQPPAPAPAAAASPHWSPSAPTNREVLPTFSFATVEPVLAEIGVRAERRGSGAQPSLLVTYSSGRRAALIFGACNAEGSACRSLSLQGGWSLPAGTNTARAAELVQAFNRRYALSRSFVLSDGTLALQRYLTADYGFIRGNLAVNLLAFGAQLDQFVAEVVTPLSGR